ncbi:MAG: diacylglycerol kinase family protein [Candidatus Doudnabacteria bacterium]|nr:diacylglycerol kinase family protein [Candidatus Doudnabacteria bacterium]MCA9387513.1 diacylglycerol kinase family protein [Candidatus Andersenbacteria bacterium]
MISLVRLAKSFKYAINGVRITLREEQNFRVHMVSGVLVALIGWAFHIEALEWVALVIVSGLVLLAEMVNTIFERIVDVLKPRIHPFAEVVKDMMAATVVLAVFVAVIVGLIIFVPYLVDFVQSFL